MDSETQPSRAAIRRVFRSCEARLAELNLPGPCDLPGLLRHLHDRRGRPIILVPLVMQPSHPSGFWLASPAADFIGYEAHTSRTHQEHIVTHELAHIICEHRVAEALNDDTARRLFPDLDPDLVREMLCRAVCWDAQEIEAEVMASLIAGRRHRRPADTVWGAPAEALDLIQRLERSFPLPVRAAL